MNVIVYMRFIVVIRRGFRVDEVFIIDINFILVNNCGVVRDMNFIGWIIVVDIVCFRSYVVKIVMNIQVIFRVDKQCGIVEDGNGGVFCIQFCNLYVSVFIDNNGIVLRWDVVVFLIVWVFLVLVVFVVGLGIGFIIGKDCKVVICEKCKQQYCVYICFYQNYRFEQVIKCIFGNYFYDVSVEKLYF